MFVYSRITKIITSWCHCVFSFLQFAVLSTLFILCSLADNLLSSQHANVALRFRCGKNECMFTRCYSRMYFLKYFLKNLANDRNTMRMCYIQNACKYFEKKTPIYTEQTSKWVSVGKCVCLLLMWKWLDMQGEHMFFGIRKLCKAQRTSIRT